jgi:hypothetical protein
MTSIENLSNELFHDIFDYLDGCEIFLTFSNFNQRFHQLLNSLSLLLKIKFNIRTVELYNDIGRQIVLLNKQQISAIQLAIYHISIDLSHRKRSIHHLIVLKQLILNKIYQIY